MPFILDPLWMLATGIGALLSLWAGARVKSAFHKYSRVGVASGMTGAQAAMAVARSGGADDVRVERHQGVTPGCHEDSAAIGVETSASLHVLCGVDDCVRECRVVEVGDDCQRATGGIRPRGGGVVEVAIDEVRGLGEYGCRECEYERGDQSAHGGTPLAMR